MKHKWVPEIEHHRPRGYEHAKVILVGTKVDLRGQFPEHEVSADDAIKLCRELNLDGYVETSAKNLFTKQAFELAISLHLKKDLSKQHDKKCVLQ